MHHDQSHTPHTPEQQHHTVNNQPHQKPVSKGDIVLFHDHDGTHKEKKVVKVESPEHVVLEGSHHPVSHGNQPGQWKHKH